MKRIIILLIVSALACLATVVKKAFYPRVMAGQIYVQKKQATNPFIEPIYETNEVLEVRGRWCRYKFSYSNGAHTWSGLESQAPNWIVAGWPEKTLTKDVP